MMLLTYLHMGLYSLERLLWKPIYLIHVKFFDISVYLILDISFIQDEQDKSFADRIFFELPLRIRDMS
jgi:hypothetical protein